MQRTRSPVTAIQAVARLSRLLERASGELSLPHYRVLSAIAAGDERASRVADRLALGKPAISTAVDALCRRGLLARGAVEGDQRAAALSLTDDGAAALTTSERAMIRRLDEVVDRTPYPDRVRESLAWLAEALDELMSERRATAERSR